MVETQLKLACPSCGSSLEYSPKNRSLKCQYCGTVTEIPTDEDELPNSAESIVPLTVELTEMIDAVYEHLASGDHTPDHLLEQATFTKKECFYVPAYAFHGNFEAQWTASFGFDRQEQYTVFETRTDNGRSRQVPVTKTKTVTDWRPVNGSDSGKFWVRTYAGKRLFESKADVVNLIEDKSGADIVAFDTSYTTGISIEEFEVAEDDSYQTRGKPQVNEIIDTSVQRHAQGDRQKDWHWTANINKQCISLLAPIWHAAYEFEGKAYNVWVSGANASRLVADGLPVDERRKHAVKIGFVPVAVALCSAGLALFKFDSSWVLPLGAVAAAGLFGFLRKNAIIGYSRNLRQSLLAGRRAAAANTAGMSAAEQEKVVEQAKKPDKTWLANTLHDSVVLPILTLVVAAVPFAQLLTPSGGDSSRAAVMPETPVKVVVAEPVVSSPVVAVVPEAPPANSPVSDAAANISPDLPVQTVPSTSTPVESPVSNTPQKQESTPLAAMVHLAKIGDWHAVDEQVIALRRQARDYPGGDKKATRLANSEGLNALKQNNFPSAVAAFEKGANADPSNAEVRNNLGFALMKAHRGDEAFDVLGKVLLDFPDRTSAWANLSELTASSDPELSTSALKLAVRFSANRDRTTTAFKQIAENNPNEKYRAVVASVLESIDTIPLNPKDSSQPTNAQSGGSTTSVPMQESRASSQAHEELESAVRQMLADGQTCISKKQYGCAITNANNVLRIKPGNSDARQLKATAEGGQAEALRNVQIR
jgi:Flp pilus assembly protein TadD